MRAGFSYTDHYLQMCKRGTEEVNAELALEWDELVSPAALQPEIQELYRTGYKRGFSTGWPSMDPFFTVRHGEFTVITGIPGHGKSSWLDNLMVNLALSQNWKWAVFSAENFPVSRHIAGLAEIYSGKPFAPGPTMRMSSGELDSYIQWLSDHFAFIQPKEDRYSLNRIVQSAIQAENIDALVIDPWNELDHSRPRDMREDEFISVCLTKLRWLARSAQIHVFVVAHPAKYIRKHGEPKPVVTLNEVKGASEWYAKADNGISVWRDEGDPMGGSDIHIQKIRFREVGRAGNAVRLYYDRVTGRFSDPCRETLVEARPQRAWQREPGEDDE